MTNSFLNFNILFLRKQNLVHEEVKGEGRKKINVNEIIRYFNNIGDKV